MIESSNANIDRLVVHQMGRKPEGGELTLSKQPLDLATHQEMAEVLKLFFFKPFKTDSYYNFAHPDGLEHNMVYQQAGEIFDNPESFYDMSINIAQLLFDSSNHPMIGGGEFYMAHFVDCVVDGEKCDAVGIFKSENKETFLKVYLSNDHNVELGTQEGISIRKLDKGCIIFNIERQDGYRVCAVDNINRGQEAHFWMDDFLGLKPRQDEFFFTDKYLQMCRGFVDNVFNEEHKVPRMEQIDLMNRSFDFFRTNPQFSSENFAQKVMQEPDIITAFNEYKNQYEQDNEIKEALPELFDISKDAVKLEKKNFKSVLKLDKNFHVYVHGDRYYLEKGYDTDRDLNYYKLYFKNET